MIRTFKSREAFVLYSLLTWISPPIAMIASLSIESGNNGAYLGLVMLTPFGLLWVPLGFVVLGPVLVASMNFRAGISLVQFDRARPLRSCLAWLVTGAFVVASLSAGIYGVFAYPGLAGMPWLFVSGAFVFMYTVANAVIIKGAVSAKV